MNQHHSSQSNALSAQGRLSEHAQCFRADASLQDIYKCIAQRHKTLILMRGVPGSGKSYLAREIKAKCNNSQVFSTDDFFYINGVYHFDPSKLVDYHARNLSRVSDAVRRRMSLVIVDNTNIFGIHMKEYINLAIKDGYEVYFVEPTTRWKFNANECFKRNSHNVPIQSIQRMIDDFQRIGLEQLIDPVKVRIGVRPVGRISSEPAIKVSNLPPQSSAHNANSANNTQRWQMNRLAGALDEISSRNATSRGNQRAPTNVPPTRNSTSKP